MHQLFRRAVPLADQHKPVLGGNPPALHPGSDCVNGAASQRGNRVRADSLYDVRVCSHYMLMHSASQAVKRLLRKGRKKKMQNAFDKG